MPPGILIADDHAGFRQAVRSLLTREFAAVQVGEAASGEEVLKSCRENRWDLVVLDLDMPGMSGLDVLERLRRSRRLQPVIILSIEPRSLYAKHARKLGAADFISKRDPPEALVRAVRKVISPLLTADGSGLTQGGGT